MLVHWTFLVVFLAVVSAQSRPKTLQIASMTAKIGRDGTDDDVAMKICSDVDIKDCCQTKLDKGVRKDEWIQSKVENWEAREFKACKNKKFKILNGPLLSVSKTGTDKLEVSSIDFFMKTANQDQTRYSCEGFNFLNDCTRLPGGCKYAFRACKNCKLEKCDGGSNKPDRIPTSRPASRTTTRLPITPPKDRKIDYMTVFMGPDGTNDNVKIKICSEDNSVCCVSDTLSYFLKGEWEKEKQEKWEAGKFGNKCKNQIFKISARPRLTLIKDGKDPLSVRALDFVMKSPLNEKEKTTYSCRGFSVTDDCTKAPNKQCTKDLGLCLAKFSGSINRSTKRPPTSRPRITTRLPITPPKNKKIDQMIVHMGSDGTKDNVKIKICSEDNSKCCVSDKLSHLLSSEWVKDKKETWEAKKFGKCKNEIFKITTRPRLTLIKDGKDGLSVNALDFVMKNPLIATEKTTYSCRGFSLNEDCTTKPNKQCTKDLGLCFEKFSNSGSRPTKNPNSRTTSRRPNIPTKSKKIDKMIVYMGPDGTGDDVKIKVCSEDNSICCVSDTLSHLLSSEWVKDKTETWNAGDFGKCKKEIFKVSLRPRLTVIKKGKDNLSVKALDFVMKDHLNDKEKTTYSCRGFSIIGDCTSKQNKECTKDLGLCLEKFSDSGSRPTLNPNSRTTTRRPNLPTKDKKIHQMVVYVGADGTNDNVKMKVCSEDNSKCCISDKLSHILSSEWVKDKKETWNAGDFGKCKKDIFKISSRPRLTLIKDGKDNLSVKALDFVMKNPLNEKEQTTYACRGFSVIGDCSQKPNKQCVQDLGLCLEKFSGSNNRPPLNPNSRVTTRPPKIPQKDQKIHEMIVNMGADGTRDDVMVEICSDDNSVCCVSGELSNTFSREWVENKKETWDAGDFGSKCKKQVFKISTRPKLRLIKNGKDDMSVKSLDLIMKNAQNESIKTTYACRGFSVTGDCSKNADKKCKKDLGICA